MPAHKNLIQGVHRIPKRQVKNPHAGPSAIRLRGLFFTAKQHRPRYGITRGRCCYFYLIKKMRTASVTAFSQKMLSFWLQPYHTVPHAKSQSLLSRAVYLCQFFLSSIENFVCHNLRQHRTIPALRLKHRSGSCGTASALPKCSIRHPVLSALLAWHLPHLARRIGT